jgi:hypothetical protein
VVGRFIGETGDGVRWDDPAIDANEMNEMMADLWYLAETQLVTLGAVNLPPLSIPKRAKRKIDDSPNLQKYPDER